MSSSSESVLDHIADYLTFISNAQSFWFTLNTSYDHGCHLASQYRLEPNDYEVLLVVAGLALYTQLGFAIKPTAWRKFLSGHRFAAHNYAIELEQKKIDINAYIDGTKPSRGNRGGFYIMRIGNKTEQSPNKIEEQIGWDGQLITTPPQLNGLRIKQQSIIRIVEPFIWNFIVENDDKDDKDNDKDEEDSDQKSMSAPFHSLGSPPVAGTTAISPATSSMSSNKKRKLNVGTSNNDDNDDNNVETLYPHLSRALGGENDGFDMTNPSVLKSMQASLTELTHIFSTEYELKVKDVAKVGHEISYVRVPRASSNQSFQNSKEWIDAAIIIAGSKHEGTFESAYRIANHLICFYKDSVIAACETQQIPICQPMSATAFSAMLHAGKVSGTGERELKKHLHAHLGQGFCPSRRSVNMLAEGHSMVHYGCMVFTFPGKEKAEFIE